MNPLHGIPATLSRCGLFRGLSAEELGDIAPGFERETLARHASLPPERALDTFTLIASGRIEVMRHHPETNRRLTVALLEPFDAFDILTLMDGQTHDVITITAGPVESLVAPLPTVRRWIDRIPALEHALIHSMADQMRHMENLAADIALFDTPTRLSNLILQYAEPGDRAAGGQPPYVLSGMSHEMIARMIGTVRAVVNRCLQELKADHVVELRRNEIRIKDLEAIMERADRLHPPPPAPTPPGP